MGEPSKAVGIPLPQYGAAKAYTNVLILGVQHGLVFPPAFRYKLPLTICLGFGIEQR